MLAKDWELRKPSYDFIIVGSGYGGAINAARISSAPSRPSVCVLERGREWEVGQFPDTLDKVLAARNGTFNPTGLYEFLAYPEITVLKGCGLGGTSLINANVAIQPDDETFEQSAWPRALNATTLANFYQKAKDTLAAVPHPRSNPAVAGCLRKVNGLDRRAQEFNQRAYGLNIAVNHTIDGVNAHGVAQKPCIDCGDCVTGCNVGAKNTLAMNYLPIAAQNGADIFTKCQVRHVEKLQTGGWRVHLRRFDNLIPTDYTLDARNVILSGGSLGTTEILLRSEKKGLPLSPKIGTQFSGNGDFFALAYNADHQLNTMGFGKDANHQWRQRGNAPGPSIVGAVKYDKNLPLSQRILVEDFSFPKAYLAGARLAFDAAAALGLAQDTDAGDEKQELIRRQRNLTPDVYQFNDNALNHTMLYLIMGHDDAKGTMRLKRHFPSFEERIEIDWDMAGRQPVFDLINEEIRRHARALGASFLTNPLWQFTRDKNLITAHPLGGCPVGEDYLHGAVDAYGRVFAGDGAVHDGLYVADGSLIPTALGVNPFLTISALSEHIADRIVRNLNGEAYPAPAQAVSMARLHPQEVITLKEPELERLFSRVQTQPAAGMVNAGTASYDAATRTIRNDHVWKGFFPRGHILNQLSTPFFASFRKRFSWQGNKLVGLTSDSDGRINARNEVKELNLSKREGNLEPGKYILLRYTEPQWRGFYDVFKKVSDDLLIGRVYLGDYPNGHRLFTFPMTRSYGLDNLTVADHRTLYAQSAAPTKAQLHGLWEMRAVSNAHHTGTLAYLKFDHKPDDTLQANYQFLGLLEGLAEPVFGLDHFRMNDFTPFHDEIRWLDADTMLGKYVTATPPALAHLFGDQSLGIIQNEEKDGTGKPQFGFYYVLRRSQLNDAPATAFLRPLLDMRLPSGISLQFDEEMDGRYFAGHRVAAGRLGDLTLDAKGPNDGTALSFTARITARDVNEFCASPEHEASIGGTLKFADWQGQGARAFEIKERKSYFNYLRVNAATGEAEMLYRLYFDDGNREYLLHGRKYLQKDAGGLSEVMRDFTTLYVHLTETATGKELGTARMHFRILENPAAVESFVRYLTSFRVLGTDNLFIQAQAQLRYLALTNQFITREYDLFGSLLS